MNHLKRRTAAIAIVLLLAGCASVSEEDAEEVQREVGGAVLSCALGGILLGPWGCLLF